MRKLIYAINLLVYIATLAVIIPNAKIPVLELEAGGISFFQLDMNFVFSAVRYAYAIITLGAFAFVAYLQIEKQYGNILLYLLTITNILFVVWFAYKYVM